jgi:N-acetyl-anhydromuramyl-L-alanine amidase AmpD
MIFLLLACQVFAPEANRLAVAGEREAAPLPSENSPLPPTSEAPAPPAGPTITPHLLPWDDERERLTVAYRKQHQRYTGEDSRIEPRVVVLHWTGGSTATSAWNTFAPTRAADARPELAGAGDVNVSAHYLVSRDGSIEQLLPEDRMARHCIGLNHISIGIENVGSADLGGDPAKWPLTEAQVQANVDLILAMKGRWPIERVIGHLEYRKMEGSSYFLEADPNYRTGKPDPGAAFVAAVRKKLEGTGITGP